MKFLRQLVFDQLQLYLIVSTLKFQIFINLKSGDKWNSLDWLVLDMLQRHRNRIWTGGDMSWGPVQGRGGGAIGHSWGEHGGRTLYPYSVTEPSMLYHSVKKPHVRPPFNCSGYVS